MSFVPNRRGDAWFNVMHVVSIKHGQFGYEATLTNGDEVLIDPAAAAELIGDPDQDRQAMARQAVAKARRSA